MKSLTLNENWKMRCVEDASWQEAVVPGSVYTDLLRNGTMEDPFWKDNEDAICALMEKDYEYICTFDAGDVTADCDKVLLHFDGLDTLADIYLNEKYAGKAFNQHRIWEYDVMQMLADGENTLRLVFHSPLKYIAAAFEKYGNIGNDDTFEGFMHLRKAHYMMGWDWGAHLPDAGVFRDIRLIGIKGARIGDVHIRQVHEEHTVTLRTTVTKEEVRTGTYRTRLELTDPNGNTVSTQEFEGTCETKVEEPKLWWPNGLGEQPLYTVRVTLLDEQGTVLDTDEKRIGLRTMTMRIRKDQWGECFAHEVNGKTVFAMGADYIPEDHLLGRRSAEKTRKLLMDCKLANYNCIRVWGGGHYPDDWFYDICDELGLMVWQDFMFACSVYELTPEFEENIRAELADNIKRLRHHASLGLWCGNNEMEMFVDERNWVTKYTEVRDYLFMYERIFPKLLAKYDPDTFYWPASPSSGGSFDHPNDPNRGDVHYWKVWHGGRPFSEYRKFYFRYASEFGFQAFPSVKTLQEITDDPTDLNPFSYVIEKHQRNYGANGKIMTYMQQAYRYPTDFSTFVYASQLLQADGIRYGVEHFRRNRDNDRCMGAIYWQLNDCWPVISWSSIDYCGRWKALHYYAKRFFARVMISCHEEGWMTQEANMNRQHFEFEKSIHLNVANETLEDKEILVRWEVRGADGKVVSWIEPQEETLTVPALSTRWLEKVELPQVDVFTEYVNYEAWENGTCISRGTVNFSYPKYFRYLDPHLTVGTDGEYVEVTADAYAKSVEILNENEDLLLEDNYFDLNADTRKVKILRGKPEGLRVRSVYDIR